VGRPFARMTREMREVLFQSLFFKRVIKSIAHFFKFLFWFYVAPFGWVMNYPKNKK
jgi:hypothetical protein